MRRATYLAAVAALWITPVVTSAQPEASGARAPGNAEARPADGTPPSDPASVLELVRQANAKSAAKQWNDAAALMERVVQLNPVNPSYWYALATTRYYAAEYRDAIPAYERAAELGAPTNGPYFSLYNLACCHALLGEKDLAIAALQRALEMGFPDLSRPASDPNLASLRDDPRFKELLWLADVSTMSRDEGWRYDLSVLASEVRRKGFNPRLSVHRPVTWEQFDEKVRHIRDAIPGLTDGQIILELMELMGFLQDGHSAVWSWGENPLFRAALPLRFFWFEEGMFVTAADRAHEDLLGAQVIALDGRTIDDLHRGTRARIVRDRGSPMADKTRLPYEIRTAAVLHAAGLADRPDRVTLTVRDRSGATRDVVVEVDTAEPDIWNTLPAPASWVTLASTLPSPPLYVRHMDKAQWFEYLPEHKIVYFQFNKVLNGEGESLAQFAARLLKFIDENDVEKLVIDMRWNNGGSTNWSHPLLLGLIGDRKINRKGRLFVIIGRRTYSAAQNTATYFERYTNAIFVGEPTGSSPNFVGEEVPVTLPYSKVMANVSHLFWQSSWPQDQRMWLAPQIYTPPTFADFQAGRDAALEAILNLQVR